MKILFHASILALAMLTSQAMAATARLPAAKSVAPVAVNKPYDIKGFRSALFGQGQAQIIAAIEKDFGVKAADIQHLSMPNDGTTALVVNQPQMMPAPGPVTITYLLGKNGNLIHVNVVWLITGEPNGVQRSEMVQAGLTLATYFRAYSWDTDKSAVNIPTGPNSVMMFLGRDKQGGTIQVKAAGVTFEHTEKGHSVTSPTPSGPVQLEVSYGAANEGSDIVTIKAGQF